MTIPSGPLQVRIAGHTHTVERDGDTVLLNGVPTEVTLTRLDEHMMLVIMDGKPFKVGMEPQDDGTVITTVGGIREVAEIKTATDLLLESFGMDTAGDSAGLEVRAPMPGLVLRILVKEGDAVEAGQGVAVLEAMKMENELKAPASGTVAAVHTEPGAAVGKNDLLIQLGA